MTRSNRVRPWLRYGYLVLLPVALLASPVGEASWFASLLGVNAGYLVLRSVEETTRPRPAAYHAGRIAIAASILAAVVWAAPAMANTTESAARAAVYGVCCMVVTAVPGLLADRLLVAQR